MQALVEFFLTACLMGGSVDVAAMHAMVCPGSRVVVHCATTRRSLSTESPRPEPAPVSCHCARIAAMNARRESYSIEELVGLSIIKAQIRKRNQVCLHVKAIKRGSVSDTHHCAKVNALLHEGRCHHKTPRSSLKPGNSMIKILLDAWPHKKAGD